MAKAVLVSPDIERGQELLDLLDGARVPVNAALWQRDENFDRWSLIVVTPLVDRIGISETYGRLIDLVGTVSERPAAELLDVSVLSPKASFYKSLRRAFPRVRNRVVTKQPIGDHYVESGFIYFVK